MRLFLLAPPAALPPCAGAESFWHLECEVSLPSPSLSLLSINIHLCLLLATVNFVTLATCVVLPLLSCSSHRGSLINQESGGFTQNTEAFTVHVKMAVGLPDIREE